MNIRWYFKALIPVLFIGILNFAMVAGCNVVVPSDSGSVMENDCKICQYCSLHLFWHFYIVPDCYLYYRSSATQTELKF